jgi:ATP-binding cassette subfamily F protein 3
MLKVENLSKQYFETLFENVTFLLGNNEKVGLVGLNGCGKSTLIKIIAGLERSDSGQVEVVNEVIGYLPQEFSFEKDMLVGEFLESLVDDHLTEMYKVDIILAKLNEADIDHYQDINSLSEGQKMKLKLAELLINKPTILLLDEPTNHLDIDGILWFEEFINEFEGICIIISHDREFLNNICNKIFEIDDKKLLVFEGNYDDYIEGKADYIEERDKQFKAQERKRSQLEALLTRARRIKGGVKRGQAVRAAKSRLKREVLKKEVDQYEETKIRQFNVEGFVHDKKIVLDVENLSFGYKRNNLIMKDSNFSMRGKEKVWFYGPNGIGKTTFIKLLTGELEPRRGNIKWGDNITWTYFSQDQKHLDMEASVEDYFLKETNISFDRSFGVLERFLFPKDLRKYKLKTLSPGQRARLSFACFAQHEYDVLILDEPTNHLDIKTKEVIENALREFQGAVLVISHDRYFISSIGINKVITLENRQIVEREG